MQAAELTVNSAQPPPSTSARICRRSWAQSPVRAVPEPPPRAQSLYWSASLLRTKKLTCLEPGTDHSSTSGPRQPEVAHSSPAVRATRVPSGKSCAERRTRSSVCPSSASLHSLPAAARAAGGVEGPRTNTVPMGLSSWPSQTTYTTCSPGSCTNAGERQPAAPNSPCMSSGASSVPTRIRGAPTRRLRWNQNALLPLFFWTLKPSPRTRSRGPNFSTSRAQPARPSSMGAWANSGAGRRARRLKCASPSVRSWRRVSLAHCMRAARWHTGSAALSPSQLRQPLPSSASSRPR